MGINRNEEKTYAYGVAMTPIQKIDQFYVSELSKKPFRIEINIVAVMRSNGEARRQDFHKF